MTGTGKACPLCLHPTAALTKPMRNGGLYLRCYACMSSGFLNTDWALYGLALIKKLLTVTTNEELIALIGLDGGSARALLEKVGAVRPAAPAKEVAVVADRS